MRASRSRFSHRRLLLPGEQRSDKKLVLRLCLLAAVGWAVAAYSIAEQMMAAGRPW